MKPFDDLLPEEQEPQHEELILLLQRAYRRPLLVPPAEQAQILARVRERLVQTDQGASLNGHILVPGIGGHSSFPSRPEARVGKQHRRGWLVRQLNALVAVLVVTMLLGAALLLWLTAGGGGDTPTLTLSTNVAPIGTTTIRLALKNFTPSTRVALTHDIQEPIPLAGGSSIINVGPAGSANVAVHIDSDWETGSHLLVAEDLKTRYTASATLQITGTAPTPPPHLQLDSRPLDVGAAVVGANSIRPFKLANSGSGSITWSASSKQAWLLVSPSQGTFSSSQTISIAVQRAGLKPGEYRGDLAISSNVGPTQHVEVDMSVLPLPSGPVLALSPTLLSFSANDGQANPSPQTLTISNPGARPLAWSLASQAPATATAQLSLLHALGPAGNWLSAAPLSGVVAPGATAAIQVVVRSQSILPGTYTDTLLFTAQGALDSPQAVNVSLTVLPHCGIVTNSGFLSFTAVQGQSTLGTQALSLNATVGCSGEAITWKLAGTPSWVAVTPASGQLRDTTSAVVSVSVNTAGLSPNTYSGQLSFVTGMSTQTVVVKLVVQVPPQSSEEPVMGASPLSLNFSNTQGLPNPTGQVVTITNTGGSPLKWSASSLLLTSGWWSAAPTGGTIAPGQTGQVTINVTTSKLTPGTYTDQVILSGRDTHGNVAPGSPQTITVNLVMQPPCTLLPPSSSVLSFNAVQGAANPPPQTITFMGIGNCAWPVIWSTSMSSVANWLTVTNTNSIMGTGQSGSIAVAVTTAGLSAGTYQRTVSISATDASGAAVQGSPQPFTVTLTILPPCTLSPQAGLAFTVAQGQIATAQNIAVHETGTCARPVSWTATADQTWLVLAAASGTDSGGGSTLSVNVTIASLVPGTYTGYITIAATDGTSAAVVGSPQAIAVTLTVTGFTVSGSVVVCSGPAPACTTSQPLPGATVTLTSGSTTVTVTADAAGNYSFANVALGSYTLSASGTESNGTHTGSAPITVLGNTTGVIIQTF
jgi:Viral BACON domain/Carboxypeptidase regulatory-like domain